MERKMPTLLGLFFALLLVGTLTILFQYFSATLTQAKESIAPQDVNFSNISDSMFTVSWTTVSPATGFVSVKGGSKNAVFYDENDTSEKNLSKTISHNVTITGLEPETDYTVKIVSAGQTFTGNALPFKVRTGPIINSRSGNLGPAYGKITDSSSLPVAGALVYLTLQNGQLLSAQTTKNGAWLVPLNVARSADLSSYLLIEGRETENIKVIYDGKATTAITDTLNDSPVPDMELGKTYDFRRIQAKTNEMAQNPAPVNEKPAVLGAEISNLTVSLNEPAEGAALPTNLPLISGKGIPGKSVSVVLGITNILSGSTTVAGDGTWQFTPPAALSPGLQSVTVTTVDGNNKPAAITHTFTILKSGTQVLGVATPSATLAPTLTPVITATPTATLAGQPVPTSGTTLPTILLFIFGLTLLGSGIVLIK